MIQPKELRIGNYFTTEMDLWCIVDGIENDCVYFIEHGFRGWAKPDKILPILLNEKILKRLGFTYCETVGPNGQYYWDIWDNERIISIAKYGNDLFFEDIVIDYKVYKTPLLYVHQLQNLYFALTGNELTLNQI